MRARAPLVAAFVCSAGGFDAVVTILSALPATLPAAIVVLRHQAPRPHDLLAPILRKHTALAVDTATDGMPLTPGHVLVAPPSHHTLVAPDDCVALIPSGDRPPYRPSADLLLTSMALCLGRRAVAVVLSGYGNDGATGATAVHRFGGTVIASDEATSAVFAMPSAAIRRDEIVDHVVPVLEIAGLLRKLADHCAV